MTENTTAPAAPVGPVDSSRVPRFAGIATFARLPRLEDVGRADIAVMGVPFDSGVSYRPGARFAPAQIREASRLLRPYHPGLDVSPFAAVQVADAGDIACNPYNIPEALDAVQEGASNLLDAGSKLVTIGGDHTIALPLLDAMNPAATAWAQTPAASVPKRFAFIGFPHGAIMDKWSPAQTGSGYEMSPILQPLEPFRNSLVTISGMKAPDGNPDMGGVHMGASAAWLRPA